jgi:hypothetical protein
MPAASPLPAVLPTVIVVQQDETDWFLVNLERGDSVAVDETEARLFEICRRGSSLESATHALAELLHKPEAEMLSRIHAALERFRQSGLVAL